MALPPSLVEYFQAVADRFEAYSPRQKLEFYHNYEIVELELSLENGVVVELNVTLIEALVLMQFKEKPLLSLNTLTESIRASTAQIRLAVDYWLKTKILTEGVPGQYLLTEEDFEDSPEIHRTVFEGRSEPKVEVESEGEMNKKRRLQFANLCWHYVASVLRHSEGVGIERLYTIMRTHAMQFSKDMHLHDIKNLIDSKLAAGELVCVDNVYRLSTQTIVDMGS